MAHLISDVMLNGNKVAQAMFANRPAWHNLGRIFDPGGSTAPDSAQAMALSGLDVEVTKEEMILARDGAPVVDNFALVRQDTRTALSVVGNDYQVIQNRECFAFLDSLQADGILRYESAFGLKGGRGIVLLARMPEVRYVTPEDASLDYLLFSSWHGGGAISCQATDVRVVCANTLALAMENKATQISIRHSGDLDAKLATARDYLAQLNSAFTGHNELKKSLLKGHSPEQAREFIAQLFPEPKRDASERVKRNRERKIAEVRQAFLSPAQRLASVKGTWWALFNAVTEVVDHGQVARQSRDMVARAENRFLSVTQGEGAQFKSRAFALALSLSA